MRGTLPGPGRGDKGMLGLASYANVITGIEGTDKSHLKLILLLDRLLSVVTPMPVPVGPDFPISRIN